MHESKNSRYSIDLATDYRTRLAEIAKTHKLNQGEVIEVMLDHIDPALLAAECAKKREIKVAARSPKKEMLSKLKALNPEQLAAALAAVEQASTP